MAFSFQEQHPNFLLDSVYLPKTPVDMLLLHQAASSCFSTCPYSSQGNDFGGFERSCVDTGRNATSAESQLVCSPILMPEYNVESQRKSREEESFNTDQSKDGKGKKMKRVRGGEKESKKPKTDQVNMEGSEACSDPTAGYIHVRARRGQATDSHSLAERVRREKISERMKMLQGLVPGCERVTGKAVMLDEIINYVQSLQNQVEFLSMKIASLSPILYDFNVEFDDCINHPQYLKSQKLMRDMPQPLPSLDQSRTFGSEGTNYQVMDHAPALLLQGQGSTSFSQDGGSSLQVDAQRQVFLDQLGFTNMCSFQ